MIGPDQRQFRSFSGLRISFRNWAIPSDTSRDIQGITEGLEMPKVRRLGPDCLPGLWAEVSAHTNSVHEEELAVCSTCTLV